ncbi:14471_t:CDS:2, partial [Gigaspora rosea]
ILATTYHCKRCKEDFKCTKKISPKQRKEPSRCDLCGNQHIRCEDNKCENCCKKFNKCNNPDNLGCCDHCTELGLECEYTFPRTKEEFKKYSSKLDYVLHQFESIEGVVYNQAHLIFKTNIKMTMKSVKKLFEDEEIYFPSKEEAKDDSSSNNEYAKKKYNRCKLHHNPYDNDPKKRTFCKCNLSDLHDRNVCKSCNNECCSNRTLARLRGPPEIVGPFEFGEWRYLKGSNENQECEEINQMKLEDMKRTEKIITENIPLKKIVENPGELLPRNFIRNLKDIEYLEKKQLEHMNKIIPEKKFYPKNFFFYGDSGPGKSTLMNKLASALAKCRPICTKTRDSQYIDYENQVCIKKDELTDDSFNFEELMSCCEKDQINMKRKNKQSIGIVSKRFTRTQAYTHGYIIKLEGRYVDGRVKFTIESDKFNLPGDLNDFINGNFNIKFVEGITLEEAKNYVYDDEFDDLYEKEDEVYLKIKVDMSYILGGVICADYRDDNVFWVYNKYWKDDLPSSFIYPDNLTKIDKKYKKLRETITRNMNKNSQENSFNENAQGENSFNENVLEDNNSLNEDVSEWIFNENALEDNFSLNENVSEGKNKELEVNEESGLDKHANKKNKP